jgi:2-epi-5-epi-valiolone synthase
MNTTSNIGSWVIEAQPLIRFKIKNSPDLFSKENTDILEFGGTGNNSRRMIVIDLNICQHYLDGIKQYFDTHKIEIHVVAVEATEGYKNLDSLLLILAEMERFGLVRRSEPVIAIGGGVLLDLVGMAAGLYRRGVPYIRVPTTLVGLVDASVGAKTGINYEGRRNRLGSYYPPLASYLDKAFLKTLAPIEISSGLGEILKMAVIKDSKLFKLLEVHGETLADSKFGGNDVANDVINLAVQGMKDELENNLWETDLKRKVDFGHSFSPIIEMRSIDANHYLPLTHGQAVTLDLIFSSIISSQRNLLSKQDLYRIAVTAKSMGLPTDHDLFHEPLVILEALNDTMKHRNGAQNLPIPSSIGHAVFINDLTLDEIKLAVSELTLLNEQLNRGKQ